MGQETRQKTAKKNESARTVSRRNAFKGMPNEYDHIRDDIRKLWTNWAATTNTSDLWRRIEQSGLDNALKKLATTKPELNIISSGVMMELLCFIMQYISVCVHSRSRSKKNVSSDDAANISGVMTEFSEVLSCIRLAYVNNEEDILDNDEHEKKYVAASCPTIVEIWRAYTTFAAEYAKEFVESGWLNSSEHRALLSSVVEVAANSAKLLIVAVNMKGFHSQDNCDAIYAAATSEGAYVCKMLEGLVSKVFALGDDHSAMNGLMELVGWTLYGLTHITSKVVKVDLEARASDASLDDQDELIDNINAVLQATKDKWDVDTRPVTPPQPTQTTVPDKKNRKKKNDMPPPSKEQSKAPEPKGTEEDRKKDTHLDTLQKLGQVYQKYSDEAWDTKRLPVSYGSAGAQMMYRMECYDELGKIKVDACPVSDRKRILDSLALTEGHVLHSDIFVIGPEPMECSKEVTLKFPLLSNKPADGSEIYLKLKEGDAWREVEKPEKVTEDEQTFFVFNTTKCEAFTALSFSPSDALMVGPSGASYVNDENQKVEVVIPHDCFTSDVTVGIKVLPFTMTDSNSFRGTVRGSPAVELTPETAGCEEMQKAITVQVPLKGDDDDKDTELVVVRYKDDSIQVLDKKQMAIRMVDSGVYAVDFKGFWCIAILRIKRIFLNMRESIKKEFLIGYGLKVPCNILTFIDDVTRGDEKQTFVMEVVEKREAENTVDLRRQQGLVEVKRGRSKEILLKRGDQILMVIDGQMRATEALKDEDCTLCFVQGVSNVVSIPTEIKRDPEKYPDAMVIYKKCLEENWLHSLAIMTRDLSELATEEITARTSSNMAGKDGGRNKSKEDATNILKMESLMSLARELTFDEGSCLGHHLGIKDDTIKQIKEANEKDPVAGNFQILCWWRGRFARATMADFLVSCLKAVGKPSYADLVAEVRKHNRCLRKEDFEMFKNNEKITG